jgi:hypothetical protein
MLISINVQPYLSLNVDGFLFCANYLIAHIVDLVLKDKIFVYDLENMRMGWADYDCKHKFFLAIFGHQFLKFFMTLVFISFSNNMSSCQVQCR